MEYCQNCGYKVNPSDLICKNCGSMLVDPHAQPTTSPTDNTVPANRTYYENFLAPQDNQSAPNQQPQASQPDTYYGEYRQQSYAPPQSYYQQPYTQQPPYQPPYGQSPYSYYPSPPRSNGLAVASLVLSIVGMLTAFCYVGFVPALLAIIFGGISSHSINHSNGTQSGKGMAIAGLITGIVALVLSIALIVIRIAIFSYNTGSYYEYGFNGLPSGSYNA